MKEFKITGIDKTIENNLDIGSFENKFEYHEDQDSISVQRRRTYLMEMNDDFDVQQVFKEINWNQRLTE